MKCNNGKTAAWFAAGILAALGIITAPRLVRADGNDGAETRLRRLEAHQEIENLFAAYGATLDRHDFDAFGRLFTEDAVYGSGPGATHGRVAIQAMLEKQISSNPSNLPGPDYHLFFNPSIQVTGDHAVATSKGAYVIPDAANNGVRLVFFVQYDDTLVRKGGRWLFASRALRAGAPPPAAK